MTKQSILTVVARLHPQIWEIIGPRGPNVRTRFDIAALNPQPLPPGPPPDPLLVGAAEMAHALASIAVEAEVRGESAAGFVNELIDDWCGTSWPRKWPWPGPGPRPDESPFPDPWRLSDARAVGAVVFASIGSRLGDGELGAVLTEGAARLADAAVSG